MAHTAAEIKVGCFLHQILSLTAKVTVVKTKKDAVDPALFCIFLILQGYSTQVLIFKANVVVVLA